MRAKSSAGASRCMTGARSKAHAMAWVRGRACPGMGMVWLRLALNGVLLRQGQQPPLRHVLMQHALLSVCVCTNCSHPPNSFTVSSHYSQEVCTQCCLCEQSCAAWKEASKRAKEAGDSARACPRQESRHGSIGGAGPRCMAPKLKQSLTLWIKQGVGGTRIVGALGVGKLTWLWGTANSAQRAWAQFGVWCVPPRQKNVQTGMLASCARAGQLSCSDCPPA